MGNQVEDGYLALKEGYRRYLSGENPTYSTSISGLTTAGYSKLDFCGEFEFPVVVDQETFKVIELKEFCK